MDARRWAALATAVAMTALAAQTVANSRAPSARVASGPVRERVVARAIVVPAEGVARVRARTEGRVLAVAVREGDRVEVGQLLAVLDDAVARAELDRRTAERNALAAGGDGGNARAARERLRAAD